MHLIEMKPLRLIFITLLLSLPMLGCTVIGMGIGATVGAVSGTGGAASMVGGALIGGMLGNDVSETPAEERITESKKLR